MQDHELHVCGRIGMKNGLLCATLGVLAATLLITPWGAIEIALGSEARFLFGLFIALGALYMASAYFGRVAGKFVCRTGNKMTTNLGVGVSLALGSLAISVLAGSISLLLMDNLGQSRDSSGLLTIIVGPLFWVFVFGGAPAVLLGVLYGILVGTQLAKLHPATEAEQPLAADAPARGPHEC
jgi:hypothetical protein